MTQPDTRTVGLWRRYRAARAQDDGLRALQAISTAETGSRPDLMGIEFGRGWAAHQLLVRDALAVVADAEFAALTPDSAGLDDNPCGECGHDQTEHVHYCSHEERETSCYCNAEYARLRAALRSPAAAP